jgi:hypothetical protein
MDEWLTQARDALAAATGAEPAELDVSDADADTLLDLARIAAHTSGARTNAPLLCYLVGRAQGARGVDELAKVIRRSTS